MKNRYIKHSHIPEYKFREVAKLFCEDLTAQQIANITSLNRNTINRHMTLFRERIVHIHDKNIRIDSVPILEWAKNRKRPLSSNVIIFGIIKEEDYIYTEIIPESINNLFHDIMKDRMDPIDIAELKKMCPYHSIANIKKTKYCRMKNSGDKITENSTYIDSIESFWGYTKKRLSKFQSISNRSFNLHLKESEFRFNNRNNNIHKMLLKSFRKEPLS